MSAVAYVTTEKFGNRVLKSKQPVLVDFYADWCGPCRAMVPILEQLAGEVAGRAKIMKVNIEENPELASRYRVSSIPMLALFRGGALVKTLVGLRPIAELRRAVDQVAPAKAAAKRSQASDVPKARP